MAKKFNIHDWQAKQRLDEQQESMSNADIGALNKIVKKYSMDKIIKTINILKDRPLPESDVDEASMTGTGASFQAGVGAGYATPYAFKKKRKNKKD